MGSSTAGQVHSSLRFVILGLVCVALGWLSIDVASSQAQFQPPVELGQLPPVQEQIDRDRPYQPPQRGIPGRREAAGSR